MGYIIKVVRNSHYYLFALAILTSPLWVTIPIAKANGNDVTARVNLNSQGDLSNESANQLNLENSLNEDGRYLTFSSYATNLVPNDTNNTSDVFLKDLWTGDIQRISLTNDGSQASGHSYSPQVSADGKIIVFTSAAKLVNSDTNNYHDVYLRDLVTQTTELISGAVAGSTANHNSWKPKISANGRYVAFESNANNLVDGDTNSQMDVFFLDRESGITERISVSSQELEGEQESNLADGSAGHNISDDGRFIAFASNNSLDPTHPSSGFGAYVRDRTAGTTELVSLSNAGSAGHGTHPVISADGSVVAFTSGSKLVDNTTTTGQRPYIRNRALGTTELIPNPYSPNTGNVSDISADGKKIVYRTNDGDDSGSYLIVQYNTELQTAENKSPSYDGSPLSTNSTFYHPLPSISGDGKFISFVSLYSNLIPNDTNGKGDLFIRGPLAPFPPRALTSLVDANGNINLSWSAPVDTGTTITGFKIYRGTDPANLSYLTSVNMTSFSDLGAASATPAYYYAVSATNIAGESLRTSIIRGAKVPPQPPTNLTAANGNNAGIINLAWSAPVDDGGMPITGYSVFRRTGTDAFVQVGNVTATSFSDSGLQAGTTYEYYVKAINTIGSSDPSVTVSKQAPGILGDPVCVLNICI